MEKKTCDFCKEESLDEYVDGKTRFGPWANMCLSCAVDNAVGLGTGLGQRYVWDFEQSKYIKIAG